MTTREQLLAQRALAIPVINPPPVKARSKTKRQRRAWQLPDRAAVFTGDRIPIGEHPP
jgi:hypothetical protein